MILLHCCSSMREITIVVTHARLRNLPAPYGANSIILKGPRIFHNEGTDAIT